MMLPDEIKTEMTHKLKLVEDPDYRSNFLNQKISERLSIGGDCYPWRPENVMEALHNVTLEQATRLGDFSQPWHPMIGSIVVSYWANMAQVLSERELDK